MRAWVQLMWMVPWCAAVSSGCATNRAPSPVSPASPDAEEAPAREVATSLTRDPLADVEPPSGAHPPHHHHHHHAPAGAAAPHGAQQGSSAAPAPAAHVHGAAGLTPPATPAPHAHDASAGRAASSDAQTPPPGTAPTHRVTPQAPAGLGPVRSAGSASATPRAAADGGAPAEATEYVCPMHPDVREPKPGRCPRCGMALVPTPLGPPNPQPKPDAGPVPKPPPKPEPPKPEPPKPEPPKPEPAPKPAAKSESRNAPQSAATEYVCPMHPEVREPKAGRCPRCGMALVPTPAEPQAAKPQSAAGPASKPSPSADPRSVPQPTAAPAPKFEAGHEHAH